MRSQFLLKTATLAATVAATTAGLTAMPQAAQAMNLQNFTVQYSGTSFGNIDGTITLDLDKVVNSGINAAPVGPDSLFANVLLFVSGSTTQEGNGTFTTADFADGILALTKLVDFNKDLVGQAGFDDFNLFSNFERFSSGNPFAPDGISPKVLALGGMPEDQVQLTSFAPAMAAPATAVPTPALLPGLIGMGIAAFRKRQGARSEVMAAQE